MNPFRALEGEVAVESIVWRPGRRQRLHGGLFACAAAFMPIVLVVWMHFGRGIPIQDMTRDVSAIGGIHPLAGFLSSLGILLWATSGSIWIFSAFVLHVADERRQAPFAFGFGTVTWLLVLDDLFQFHESLVPTYLGWNEEMGYALLGTAILALLAVHRRSILESPFRLLAVSFLCFGASVFVDVLEPWLWRTRSLAYLLEDGLKWLGIVSWSAYAASWCRRALIARLVRR